MGVDLKTLPKKFREKVEAELKRRKPPEKRAPLLRLKARPVLRMHILGRSLGVAWPLTAQALIEHLTRTCGENGMAAIGFAVDELPKSVNHQYIHTRHGTRLAPEVKPFRARVAKALDGLGWRPTGVTAALIFFESPLWVTKERRVREMDCDNRVKPIFDAIQEATGAADEFHWEFHVWKVPSKRTRTVVYLFDLGDVVHFFG